MNSEGVGKKEESVEKRPEDVVGFLREYNFGTRDEDARVAVERFRDYMREISEVEDRIPRENFKLIDLFIDELEKAGFAEPGTISHEKWTEEAGQALTLVLMDFEKHPTDWQKEVSKDHDDWVGTSRDI